MRLWNNFWLAAIGIGVVSTPPESFGEEFLGYSEFDGKVRAVYSHGDFENLRKYFRDDENRMVDVKDAIARKLKREAEVYGTLSTTLHARLQNLKESDSIAVR